MVYFHLTGSKRRLSLSMWLALCLGLLLMLGGCANPFVNAHVTATATTSASYRCVSHSNTPVTLSMYYGSEKQAWMTDVVNTFNQQQVSACDGSITVHAVPYGSGESLQA